MLNKYVTQQHDKQGFIRFTVATNSPNFSNALKQRVHQEHE